MAFTPYIHFEGTCADAMEFYAKIFGGTPSLMYYRDAPDIPEEWKKSDRIIHAELKSPGGVLMASDFAPGSGDKQAAVSIMRDAPTVEAARDLFNRIGDGGDLILPFEATFFSPGFGMVRDRFGTHWMIAAKAAE